MTFREASAADREAILALRGRCFGEIDPEKRDPRFWDWEFSGGRCFVGEDAGRVLTHIALVPVTYAIDGSLVRGATAVDAMTSPDARGHGWFSRVVRFAMESTRDDFAISTAYQIRGAVLGAMLRSGWVVAEKVPVLVRPVFLPALHRTEVRVLMRDDVQTMAGLTPAGGASIARTPEFLAWRFFDNPRWKYRVTAVDDGYLVARRTTLKGFDTYAIVDLAFRTKRTARALIAGAIHEAKRLGCTLVASLVSRAHPAFVPLLLRGFVPGPHRFRLLVHPKHVSARWRVMWADTDHL